MPFSSSAQAPIRYSPAVVGRDLLAGLVVFQVALPLCLGIALASRAPMASGRIAGVIGGIIVRVGDRVMDGSVRRRLGILRNRMIARVGR